jgi:hypothetical protein
MKYTPVSNLKRRVKILSISALATITFAVGCTPYRSKSYYHRVGERYYENNNPAHLEDYDGDGLCDIFEQRIGTSIFMKDTDLDGLSDLSELLIGTHPLIRDTDGDLIPDGYDLFPLVGKRGRTDIRNKKYKIPYKQKYYERYKKKKKFFTEKTKEKKTKSYYKKRAKDRTKYKNKKDYRKSSRKSLKSNKRR